MERITIDDTRHISGGKPKFINVITGTVFGAIGGFIVGGPPGAIAGAINGTAMAIAKEGAQGLSETLHPELFENPYIAR